MSDPRTAVVTGASRGIGLAVARAFVERGMRVAMIARSADMLHGAAESLGSRAIPIACDVADPHAIGAMTRKVHAEFGDAPDVIVNNAGLFRLAAAKSTDAEEFIKTLHVNLVAPFRVIRTFLPAMQDRSRGHIVNVGSIADHIAFPENGAYSASKYGLRGLHEVLRAELAGTGVRTTLVSPGPTDTPLWDEVDPDSRPGFTPRASMLRSEAVAAAVLFAVTQPSEVNVDELRLSRA